MLDEAVKEYRVRERECCHRRQAAQGRVYAGEQFVHALNRLRGEAAMRMARKVEPFFWADAPRLTVWLCEDCALDAGLAAGAGAQAGAA